MLPWDHQDYYVKQEDCKRRTLAEIHSTGMRNHNDNCGNRKGLDSLCFKETATTIRSVRIKKKSRLTPKLLC
jgi:hypothetical protein